MYSFIQCSLSGWGLVSDMQGVEQAEGLWATGREGYLDMRGSMWQEIGEDHMIKTLIIPRAFKSRGMESSDMQCRLLDNNWANGIKSYTLSLSFLRVHLIISYYGFRLNFVGICSMRATYPTYMIIIIFNLINLVISDQDENYRCASLCSEQQ